jgi:hypothetical protein
MVGGMAAMEMDVRGFADYRAIEWRATRGVVTDLATGFNSSKDVANSPGHCLFHCDALSALVPPEVVTRVHPTW